MVFLKTGNNFKVTKLTPICLRIINFFSVKACCAIFSKKYLENPIVFSFNEYFQTSYKDKNYYQEISCNFIRLFLKTRFVEGF